MNNSSQVAYGLISFVTTAFILIQGQSFIVPVILGVLLWLIIRSLRRTLDQAPFLKKHLPKWLKSVLSSLFILITLNMLFNILTTNINTLTVSVQGYSSNTSIIIEKLNDLLQNDYFKIDINNLIQKQSYDFNFTDIFGMLFNALSGIIGDTFMILLYAIFILLEESTFYNKLYLIFSTPEKAKQNKHLLVRIEESITQYFRLKTLISLITGILSYVVLSIIGIETPFFWAFLIFILNFIPTIGSLIATVFPAVFSLIQFASPTVFFTTLVLVGLVQILVGNFLEPRIMGSSMNVSPFVTIIALSFWGFIWGIMGMMLSVPITVMAVIILSQFEKTRNIAILLSENGQIEHPQ